MFLLCPMNLQVKQICARRTLSEGQWSISHSNITRYRIVPITLRRFVCLFLLGKDTPISMTCVLQTWRSLATKNVVRFTKAKGDITRMTKTNIYYEDDEANLHLLPASWDLRFYFPRRAFMERCLNVCTLSETFISCEWVLVERDWRLSGFCFCSVAKSCCQKLLKCDIYISTHTVISKECRWYVLIILGTKRLAN